MRQSFAGRRKNISARCDGGTILSSPSIHKRAVSRSSYLRHIRSLPELHTPDVLVLQDMSERGTHRARRIHDLKQLIAELAERRGVPVSTYSRAQVLEYFAHRGAGWSSGRGGHCQLVA
jgi:hypothetical protein